MFLRWLQGFVIVCMNCLSTLRRVALTSPFVPWATWNTIGVCQNVAGVDAVSWVLFSEKRIVQYQKTARESSSAVRWYQALLPTWRALATRAVDSCSYPSLTCGLFKSLFTEWATWVLPIDFKQEDINLRFWFWVNHHLGSLWRHYDFGHVLRRPAESELPLAYIWLPHLDLLFWNEKHPLVFACWIQPSLVDI